MGNSTNKNNIKTILLYIFAFIVVIIMIAGCGILFGAQQYSLVSGYYDKPRASVCFHDHKIY